MDRLVDFIFALILTVGFTIIVTTFGLHMLLLIPFYLGALLMCFPTRV